MSDTEPSVARPEDRRIWPGVLIVLGAALGFLVLVAVFFLPVVLAPYNAASQSMAPTLLVGDHFFVLKTADRQTEPRRSEIAVYVHPTRGGAWLARVIGLPGDSVQMLGGVLHINGVPVSRQLAGDFFIQADGPRSRHYREVLPDGHIHDILEARDNERLDDTPLFVVLPGHLFMMGDNRDNSLDSRTPQERGGVGFVPMENVIGRVTFIFWSDDLGRIGSWAE